MNVVCIDQRLKDIATFVDPCYSVADVGTDHGYLPIFLIQTQKAQIAYASDVAKMPLNKAKENILNYHLQDKIITILSDGLQNIPNVDTIIMAGMGGHLIVKILSESSICFHSLILQANNNIPALRTFLSNHNYEIIDEKISYCHNKYYEILKVKEGKQILNRLEIEYGPIHLQKKSNLFIQKWTEEKEKYQSILADFKGSSDEYQRIKNKVEEIQRILQKS